jgi:SAM-dependent methyltransferase
MKRLGPAALKEISDRTRAHYQTHAEAFWLGTRDHDVTQNIEALLEALPLPSGALASAAATVRHRILDFGCGPGRDILAFMERGCEVVGLDGCAAFVEHARELSGAEVLLQDFLDLSLEAQSFDGVFANASLFHVPSQELPRVLAELYACLRFGGVLFASNPRGENEEGFSQERYGTYRDEPSWRALFTEAGFEPLRHYYRPLGLPREQQPWLASVWRKSVPPGPI